MHYNWPARFFAFVAAFFALLASPLASFATLDAARITSLATAFSSSVVASSFTTLAAQPRTLLFCLSLKLCRCCFPSCTHFRLSLPLYPFFVDLEHRYLQPYAELFQPQACNSLLLLPWLSSMGCSSSSVRPPTTSGASCFSCRLLSHLFLHAGSQTGTQIDSRELCQHFRQCPDPSTLVLGPRMTMRVQQPLERLERYQYRRYG